jgi:hypothetical protein
MFFEYYPIAKLAEIPIAATAYTHRSMSPSICIMVKWDDHKSAVSNSETDRGNLDMPRKFAQSLKATLDSSKIEVMGYGNYGQFFLVVRNHNSSDWLPYRI